MTISIESIIIKNGPLLSSELIKTLKEELNISDEAIRKRISRISPPINRIKGFFADNQSFFYLKSQYQSEEYFQALKRSFQSSAKRMFAIIKGLENHGGYLPINFAAAYSFSPVGNLKGHKRFDVLISELKKLNIIYEENECYVLNERINGNSNSFIHHKSLMIASRFVSDQFTDWSRKIGLVSFNTGKKYSEFGSFLWCYSSPSYVMGLLQKNNKKPNPGTVLVDTIVNKEVTIEDIDFFLQKLDILSNQRVPRRFFPIFIFSSITSEALSVLKSNGIIVGFIDQLFGNGYSKLLEALVNTIDNAGAILKTNPDAYLTLMDRIDKLVDGKTNNLRGDLFELAVGFYHARLCKNIDIGRLILSDGQKRELDVLAVYHDKVVIAECKGYKSPVSLEEIDKWVGEKIPFIRKWIIEQPILSSNTIVFEYWAAGGYSDDAKIKIEAAKRTKKYRVEFYGPAEIIAKGKELNMARFNDTLNQYFFKEEL